MIKEPIKVFRVCPEMPYLKLFQKKLSGIKGFQELQNIYENENLFFPMGWLKSKECQNYIVENIIYADYYSQVIWAIENNHSDLVKHSDFLDKIMIEQIKKFDADIVFFNTGAMYRVNKAVRNKIRFSCKSVKAITGSWGDELPKGESYKSYMGDLDLLYACTRGYYDDIEKEKINTSYLPSSFNEYISYKKSNKKIDVCFIGATGYLEIDHFERYKKLDIIFQLLKKEKIKFSLVTKEKSASLLLRIKNSQTIFYLVYKLPSNFLNVIRKIAQVLGLESVSSVIGTLLHLKKIGLSRSLVNKLQLENKENSKYKFYLNNKQLSKKYKRYYSPPYLYVDDYYTALSASKIVLNLHRDEKNDFGNIRCFEAAGVGSCLVTDRANQISNLFNVGEEIIAFDSPQDCVDKIKNLLADPIKMKNIGERAQERVQREHLQLHRDRVIIEGFSKVLSKSVSVDHKNFLYIYDLRRYPLSYDYIFFLQYCFIKNKNLENKVAINIILPKINDLSQNFDWTTSEFTLRKTRIIDQLNGYFTDFEFFVTIDCCYDEGEFSLGHGINELPHHSEYYKYVNQNSELIKPLYSRIDSISYVEQWQILENAKSYITFTIRDSKVSKERNTNISLVKKLAKHYSAMGYKVVVIPDTNSLESILHFSGEDMKYFREAAYDFDLRLAIYEKAALNFFNNNGPCIAAGLDPKVSYLLTKLVVPTVPHCTVEFIERQGFKYGTTPGYSKNSIWLWGDEDFSLITQSAEKLIG